MSEMDEGGEFAQLEANMHLIDDFYYGVRIFPGQDPLQVRDIHGQDPLQVRGIVYHNLSTS